MRWLLLLLLPVLCAWPTVNLGGGAGAAGGSGLSFTQTFYDEFASDATGWSPRNSDPAGLTCTSSGGELRAINRTGACHYDGAQVEGTQPTQHDSWAIMEFGFTTPYENYGPSIRTNSSTPGGTDYSYFASCSGSVLTIDVCDTDRECLALAATGACTGGNGAQVAIMAAGETTATEICAWWWNSGAGDLPSDDSDPNTWGDADLCVTSTGSTTLLADVSGTSTVEDWDDNTDGCNGAPSDCKGYPSNTFTDASMTVETAGGSNHDVEWFRAGDIDP